VAIKAAVSVVGAGLPIPQTAVKEFVALCTAVHFHPKSQVWGLGSVVTTDLRVGGPRLQFRPLATRVTPQPRESSRWPGSRVCFGFKVAEGLVFLPDGARPCSVIPQRAPRSDRSMPLASAFPAGRLVPPAHTRSTAASRGREREPSGRGAAAAGKRGSSEPRSRSVPSGGADRAWLENVPERELESLYNALRASTSSGAAPPPPAAPDALTPLRPRTPPRREGALRSSDLTGVSHSSPGAYPRREERPPPGSAPPPAWRSLSPPARAATGLAARATEAVLAERRLAVNDALATAGAARARLEERLEAPLPTAGSGGAPARRELFAGLRLPTPPPPHPSRTKWTRRVPHPVLIGHAASLTPY
jgi:hypothetical protein